MVIYMAGMKAWIVQEKGDVCSAVVFAETRGQAKSFAVLEDVCNCAEFMSIEARRLKEADMYYTPGKRELDWGDSNDRIALVKDCGFTCSPDFRYPEECADCSAKDFCEDYIDEEG